MVDQLLRIGVVGLGGIARSMHLPGYMRCENIEISALCDVNESALTDTGSIYGVNNLTTDYRELVDSSNVDAVSVCTSNDMHYPVTMAALASGKHVFCEKPLGLDLSQALEMYSAAEEVGTVNGIGFVHRCTPAARLAHRLISSGALGTIYDVTADFCSGGVHLAAREMSWRCDKTKAGAGVLFDLGTHMVDMILWWLGESITDVCADLRTLVDKRRIPGSDEWGTVTTDDSSSFIAGLSGGGMAVFINSNAFTAMGMNQRVEVYGSNGAIRYDQSEPYTLMACIGHETKKLYALGRTQKPSVYPVVAVPDDLRDRWTPDTPPVRTLTPDFVKAIRGDSGFLPTFKNGLEAQKVVVAALTSAAERRWISVD